MAMTLLEAAKLTTDPVLNAVIEIYARSSDILRTLPFRDIQGNAVKYNREEALPGIGFRGVNEAFSESTGVINPQIESLFILGGDMDVDKFIVKTEGPRARATHEAMKMKAASLRFTQAFIKGDNSTDPRVFDGLQVRLSGDQVINAGTTSGGAALSLAKLDELIDAVENPTHLIMNKTLRRRLSAAARLSTVGGYITWTLDEFGRQVARYNDLPILIVDKDNENSDILPFTEAAYTGSSTATSIYCVSFSEMMLEGIQSSGIEARDLGEINDAPFYRTRVEWYAGISLWHPRAAARLRYIADLAVVA